LAAWMYRNSLNKGAVNDFFTKTIFGEIYKVANFQNADQWLAIFYLIPHGILSDIWMFLDIVNPIDPKSSLYRLYYRDVIKSIAFLIGHKLFKDDLAFVSIRVYYKQSRKSTRVYSEMNIGD
jgi:hypothetical protein